MRLREYKSTLIGKGLNYFISAELLILETIVSQRPCLDRKGVVLRLILGFYFSAYQNLSVSNDFQIILIS